MTRTKILYVDDETMALKYFERLISSIAPVITVSSVAEAIQILETQGDDIAVLVTDQRMPESSGSELLRYAKQHHPAIKRFLTTAHSGLQDAIDAFNRGEIYRYITKPWDLSTLRHEIRDALELSQRGMEREQLLREKLLVAQQMTGARRIAFLAIACATLRPNQANHAMHAFIRAFLKVQCTAQEVHPKVAERPIQLQSETARASRAARYMAQWIETYEAASSPQQALVDALPQAARAAGTGVMINDADVFTFLVTGQQPVEAHQAAWPAWLLWQGGATSLQEHGAGEWYVEVGEDPARECESSGFAADVEALQALPS